SAQPPSGYARNKVRTCADLTDGDSLSLQILSLSDRGKRYKNIIEAVSHRTNKLEILTALRPGADHGGGPLQLEQKVAGKRGLDAHPTSSDVNRLDFQSILLKRAGALRYPEITSRAAQRIADLEFSQGLTLRKEKGRNQQQRATKNCSRIC